jgi:purine-nucleoside phosphorylase
MRVEDLPSQPKILFENLVIKKETILDSNASRKVNFKKFIKIPKATTQISQRNSKVIKNKPNDKSVNNKKNVSLFKNLKNEPFDVDSQLQNFLNSQFN